MRFLSISSPFLVSLFISSYARFQLIGSSSMTMIGFFLSSRGRFEYALKKLYAFLSIKGHSYRRFINVLTAQAEDLRRYYTNEIRGDHSRFFRMYPIPALTSAISLASSRSLLSSAG